MIIDAKHESVTEKSNRTEASKRLDRQWVSAITFGFLADVREEARSLAHLCSEREREGERVEEMEENDFRGGDERGQNDEWSVGCDRFGGDTRIANRQFYWSVMLCACVQIVN